MKLIKLIVIACAISCMASCSVYMAANQPGKKDMTVLRAGAKQSDVRAELGQPVFSGKEDGCDVEVYKFTQGYSQGAKVGRAFFHGAADVLTLGMWEVVGTPVESIASGDKTTVKVFYDENMCAKKFDVKTEEKFPQQQQGAQPENIPNAISGHQ